MTCEKTHVGSGKICHFGEAFLTTVAAHIYEGNKKKLTTTKLNYKGEKTYLPIVLSVLLDSKRNVKAINFAKNYPSLSKHNTQHLAHSTGS